MIKKIIITIVVVVAAVGLLFFLQTKQEVKDPTKYDEFAKCVANTGLTMYGTYWCSHCQNEKNRFGDSFKYISYVECSEEVELCREKGIEGTPTWLHPDGGRYVGEQGLERISEITACPLPKSSNE